MNILIHNNAVPLTSQERSGLAKYRQEIDMVVNLVDRLHPTSAGAPSRCFSCLVLTALPATLT